MNLEAIVSGVTGFVGVLFLWNAWQQWRQRPRPADIVMLEGEVVALRDRVLRGLGLRPIPRPTAELRGSGRSRLARHRPGMRK
jgi:hypothetical protein